MTRLDSIESKREFLVSAATVNPDLIGEKTENYALSLFPEPMYHTVHGHAPTGAWQESYIEVILPGKPEGFFYGSASSPQVSITN